MYVRNPLWTWIRLIYVGIAENVLNRNFGAKNPNQKWFTDISYLNYGKGQKAYISAIINRYDLSIVAYKVCKRNDLKLVMDTLRLDLQNNDVSNTVLQSDRGFQYTSMHYKKYLDTNKVKISMSKAGSCLDNQLIEAFRGTLKPEYYYRNQFSTYEDIETGISKYIDYYMNKRYVPKFDGLTPNEYRNVS